MRIQKSLKWLVLAVSIVVIAFVSVIFLVIGTDTEEKETAQSDRELENNLPNEQEDKEKKEDVQEDITEEEGFL
ncbi:hypothetical protein SH601_04935 [Gracilibacillus sp. S3-1-1]|uniref:Uncharacterized protein n=1 Tax=Gracilibacillus pellucidus TaxID=3095368 RepID=A0ACC6M2Z5_9BACI|nr:hypothetical protein [Gracilibacillus sp. S3-1-1]MDX8045328.1 hypothetical protein [Gracilibacillus sp. S3-1-1]